jgi:hypothetical protein
MTLQNESASESEKNSRLRILSNPKKIGNTTNKQKYYLKKGTIIIELLASTACSSGPAFC